MDAAAEARATAVERAFEMPLLVAAVLSIPSTILQSKGVGEPWSTIGTTLNWLIWIAFLAEVVAMLVVVPDRGRYLRTHPLELAIVILTPPFFLQAVQGVRVLRVLRLARLLRLAPLVRVLCSAQGARAAGFLALLTALAGGAGFGSLERISFGNGVYWAITTMTTVGYGDITPRSSEGKILAVVLMLVGIGTLTLVIGAVAQRFIAPSVEAAEISEDDLLLQVRDISARLSRLERALRERAKPPSAAR